MDISVLVLTYNQEDTVGRTLDSVLSQRFDGEFEILLGDDCSTDGTRAVCERYASRYPDKIRYVRRERNMGVVANYFDCVRQAAGRYIADCAGDDFWVDDLKLQRQFDLLESEPDVSMVTTDWLCCDPDGTNIRQHPGHRSVESRQTYEPGSILVEILTNRIMPHLCSALYRRSIIIEALAQHSEMMEADWLRCEDTQVMMALAAAGRVVTLPGVTLHYSLGGESISHRSDFGRRFDHACASVRQMLMLQKFYSLDSPELSAVMLRKVEYLWALLFNSSDAARRPAMLRFERESGVKTTIKSKIYRLITSNRLTWRLARFCRAFFSQQR